MSEEEILTKEIDEKEIVQPKTHKKAKLAVAITASLSLVVIITLLVGHFKFNWFKSEIYDIDAKITRNLYQANYFTETKDLNTKIGFSNGVSEEHKLRIFTNFLVMITDKKDFLNTAVLVILDSKIKTKNELKDIISFDIFNEEKIKEVIANPDGSKYPLALFKFYENGTIYDIQLPKNMNEYNAKTIIELIENIIPKLSRNRTEDISNGLVIKTKKGKKKKTLVESQSPKELPSFRDSKFVKSVERDIENEKLTSVRTNSNMLLETKLKEGESSFGFQYLNYEQKSQIISTSSKEEKEKINLLQELVEHFTLVNSKDLFESFCKKENTEKKNLKDEPGEDVSKLRKLNFNVTGENTSTIKIYNTLGKKIEILISLGCNTLKAFGYILIRGSDYYGFDKLGRELYKGERIWNSEIDVLDLNFPNMTGIVLNYRVKGTVKVNINYDDDSNLMIHLDATLYADAVVKSGFDQFAYITAGARGTFLSGEATGTLYEYGDLEFTNGHFSAGETKAFIQGKDLDYENFYYDFEVYEGWEKSL